MRRSPVDAMPLIVVTTPMFSASLWPKQQQFDDHPPFWCPGFSPVVLISKIIAPDHE